MRNPFRKTEAILHSAAKIARKRNVALVFTWRDLGDLYYIYGVNASGSKLFKMLERRGQAVT